MPKIAAAPRVGRSRSRRTRMVVVFPAPLRPRKPKTSPRWMSRETPRTACTDPYDFHRSRSEMAAASGIDSNVRQYSRLEENHWPTTFLTTMSRSVALSLAAAAAVAVTLVLAFHADDALELPLRDAALRLAPAMSARSTVVVAIDEPSLRVFGRWPWPRTVLADLIDRASALGAHGVVLDVLLAEPAAGDQRLTEAMRHLRTLTIAALDDHGQWLIPVAAVREKATVAHGTFELDRDGILRRFASTKQSGNRALTALSVEAASTITDAPVPVGSSIMPM